MSNPDIMMRQATMTAHDWAMKVKKDVDELFGDYTYDQQVALFSAIMNAAALDQLAMAVYGLSEAINKSDIARELNGIGNTLDVIYEQMDQGS